jgi:hypothetical protein
VRLDLPAATLYGAEHWASRAGACPADAALASNYLPGRNLLLGSLGAVHCARRRIRPALALLGDNPFPDATPPS